MDLDKMFSFLESTLNSSKFNTDNVLLNDSPTLQPSPQISCLNHSLSLLKEFCFNEETVARYLQDEDELNNRNHGLQLFNQSTENFVDWFNLNDLTNQSHSLCTIQDSASVQNPIPSYTSTDPAEVESRIWSEIEHEHLKLKSNFIYLVANGYKLTLSLNTDNNEVEEPWNSDVGQKILSVNFSSLVLRDEYFSNDVRLNGYDSILMNEAIMAFRGQKHLSLFQDLKSEGKATPKKLISMLNGIKGFRKIGISDKISLLIGRYFHLHLIESIYCYDADVDGWSFTEFKYDRRDAFLFNKLLYNGIVNVIEAFPDRLRNDINVIILTYLIIIFNPDELKLEYPEIIRHEQYSYIYLLQRYLRTINKSNCEASDNLYRLMINIEKLALLDQQTQKSFIVLLREPLTEAVTRAVAGQNTLQFCLQEDHNSYLLL